VQGIRQTRGTQASQQTAYLSSDIGDFVRLEPELRYSFIDRGPHSMELAGRFVMARETYDDNSEAKQNLVGSAIRYMYDRTWGADFQVSKDLDFTLTDPSGVEHEIDTGLSWTTYLKYQPAMNFILSLQIGNSNRGVLRTPGTASQSAEVLKGWSWSLGGDILF